MIDSLLAAVEARPQDVPLRMHLADLLIGAGRQPEAVTQLAIVLQQEPDNTQAQALMRRALQAEPEPAKVDWSALEEQFSDVVPPRFARADNERPL